MNKIAWVTPSLKTGLGKYTDIAVSSLRQYFQIEIFVGDQGIDLNQLKDFKTIIYNIGNSRDNLPVYFAMRNYPGIVILHDRTYHHFFAYYYIEYLKKIELYLEVLSAFYGDEIAEYAERQLKIGRLIWETEDCMKYPLRDLILAYATAIVVHSNGYLDDIRKEYEGPVIYLPFPFVENNMLNELRVTKKELDIADNMIVLFSYGFMSTNRMLEETLKIIGENPEIKKRVYYVIAGSIHDIYLETIKELIDKYELNKNVRVCGFLPDRELYSYLSVADVCIKLRRYSTEGASWSLLEQLCAEKIVISSNKGFFSELPDDIMFKVRDSEDLKNKLFYIISNIDKLEDYGKRAKKYVKEKFNPEIFFKSFIDFIEKTKVERAKQKILREVLRDLSTDMKLLSPKKIQDKFIPEISKIFCEIFYERD
jgi:glycosyltransferase involved in cell wall biosynthesis